MNEQKYLRKIPCPCGREHKAAVREILTGAGVLARLPECVRSLGAHKAFLLSDPNTHAAAGIRAEQALDGAGIPYTSCVLPDPRPAPDEKTVGSAAMRFDPSCDAVVGIGSGVINDTCKILSSVSGRPYIIAATAPSMDGYASATSSMEVDGLKVTLPSRCADIIIGDTDVLRAAPRHMIASGIGDMIAKYVSIAEWRVSHIVTGEYYCEEIARMIRDAVKKCVDHADGALSGDPEAAGIVFDGLVAGGLAMAYAGISRPASGVEHYFSHVWDMRALALGTPSDLHGIQCGAATLEAVRLYGKIRKMTPDPDRASAYTRAFDVENWNARLREFVGKGAEAMIAQEAKERKYDPEAGAARFSKISAHWKEILTVLDEELPEEKELESLLTKLGIPTDLTALCGDRECVRMTFLATKDIRAKYVLSHLAWDLGVIDELYDGR